MRADQWDHWILLPAGGTSCEGAVSFSAPVFSLSWLPDLKGENNSLGRLTVRHSGFSQVPPRCIVNSSLKGHKIGASTVKTHCFHGRPFTSKSRPPDQIL